MNEWTASQIVTAALAVCSAIVLLSNAVEKIVLAVKAAKAPNQRQDERLKELEEWRQEVDRKLEADLKHLESIDEGSRATQQAILALLDHGIDGNNIEQMQHAKELLQNYLINR